LIRSPGAPTLPGMRIDPALVHPGREEVTARADVLVARAAARAHGVLSTAELRACGLTAQAISYRVAIGRLHPIHRGVYAVGHASVTQDGIYLAAVNACGERAALGMRACAALQNVIVRLPSCAVLGA